MKTKELKSITQIDGNIIPCSREKEFSCYDNKMLKDYNSDDFASFIMDCCDNTGQIAKDAHNILLDNYDIYYLSTIPKEFTRVYLYGVWMILKSHIDSNLK